MYTLASTLPRVVLATLILAIAGSAVATEAWSAEAAPQKVRFQTVAARPGDLRQQQMEFQINVNRALQQAGELVDQRQQRIVKSKERQVEIRRVEGHLPAAARVAYGASETRLDAGATGERKLVDPVAGRAYLVTRRGDQLVITDEQGAEPSAPELVWLRDDLDMFGRENPLGNFLANRELRVGESLELPPQLASDLLGSADSKSTVRRFVLTLEKIELERGAHRAHLRVVIDLQGAADGGVDMIIQGIAVMDPATIQIEQLRLDGPIRTVETQGEGVNQVTMTTTGAMTVAATTRVTRKTVQR